MGRFRKRWNRTVCWFRGFESATIQERGQTYECPRCKTPYMYIGDLAPGESVAIGGVIDPRTREVKLTIRKDGEA